MVAAAVWSLDLPAAAPQGWWSWAAVEAAPQMTARTSCQARGVAPALIASDVAAGNSLASPRRYKGYQLMDTLLRPLHRPLHWLAEADGNAPAATGSASMFPSGAARIVPLEAGFTLSGGSSGSDPAADVILRLEAETNEETKVQQMDLSKKGIPSPRSASVFCHGLMRLEHCDCATGDDAAVARCNIPRDCIVHRRDRLQVRRGAARR